MQNGFIGFSGASVRCKAGEENNSRAFDMNRTKSALHAEDRQSALSLVPVSREIVERFTIYVDLLRRWRNVTNLISETTVGAIWTRHLADCAQVLLVAPTARRWIDIGSGAGFPGLVLAMQLANVNGAIVHCIEKDQRKCAFLREAARATGSPAVIHSALVQTIDPALLGTIDGVTARAFAPMSKTVHLAKIWLERGAVGVFFGGRLAHTQISTADSSLTRNVIPSVVADSKAVIIRIRVN